MVATAPQPDASTRLRFSPLICATRSGFTSAQKPRSGAHGRSCTRSSSEPMYPSPWSQPTASSSSWSGVHIHVTAGSPFTSSQTGHSSTTAESACIRPLRSPGCLRFSAVFGVEMWPLLDSDPVQQHAAWQAGHDPFPEIHRQRLARRDPGPPLGECRDVLVNMPPVETLYDFALEQGIERAETHHPGARGIEHTFDGNRATIAMAVIVRRTRELRRVGEAVRCSKLHDPSEIRRRHGLEYPDRGGLEREHDGAAWAERQVARRFRG